MYNYIIVHDADTQATISITSKGKVDGSDENGTDVGD